MSVYTLNVKLQLILMLILIFYGLFESLIGWEPLYQTEI